MDGPLIDVISHYVSWLRRACWLCRFWFIWLIVGPLSWNLSIVSSQTCYFFHLEFCAPLKICARGGRPPAPTLRHWSLTMADDGFKYLTELLWERKSLFARPTTWVKVNKVWIVVSFNCSRDRQWHINNMAHMGQGQARTPSLKVTTPLVLSFKQHNYQYTIVPDILQRNGR